MNNIKLYEISEEYAHLLEGIYDEETGEINEGMQQHLEALKAPLEQKCIAVACYIENMDAERKAIDEHRKRLAEREARYKKRVSNLKDYLKYNMERCGIKKISSPYFDITLCKNPPSVEYLDENDIPEEFWRIKKEKDTATIKQALMDGIDVPGATLVQRNSVRIR